MNLKARADMIRAMDTIVRSINDEEIIMKWLIIGVADGDIKEDTTDEDLRHYCEKGRFAGLMHTFLTLMSIVESCDALYVDGILSTYKEV